MAPREPAGGVQSVERAFAVLRAVATEESGISEVARRVHLPISTVARLLTTLEGIGAVARVDDGGAYRIGPAITSLSDASDPTVNIVSRARPYLVELVDRVGETAGISVRDGDEVHYLDHVEGDNDVQVRSWTGAHLPLHGQGSGLILLAFAPAAFIDAYISRGLATFTPTTTTDPGRLRSRLAAARTDGFLWCYGEYADGINSIAAPVLDDDGAVVAAVHCHGPSYRFPGNAGRSELEAAVVNAARRLGQG